MKYVKEIKTPEGTGGVAYGEFMPKDGRKNLYSCWWGGCGIGGESKTLDGAYTYLIKHINKHLTSKLTEYREKEFDIQTFLRKTHNH